MIEITPLDFWLCVLAFAFDLNFDISYQIVKENHDIDILMNRFEYKNKETKGRMEKIKQIINDHINKNSRS